ncbi:MAG: DUF4878 domain-containing protein [Pyrinomonadaceae bacterium]
MKFNKFGMTAVALAAVVLFAGGCSLFSGSSPTATFKAFYEASKKKDAAAIKKTMSKGTIEMMEKMAKDSGKSLDDMLKESKTSGKDTPEKMPETRNEKIDGDKATLEVKRTESGSDWDTMPFVKEDGEWKLAFDKFIEELMNKMKEKMPTP